MTCDTRTTAQKIKDELACISDQLDGAALPDKGSVYRYTVTADSYGGHTEAWTLSGTPIDCKVGDRVTPEPVRLGERLEQQSANIVIRTRADVILRVRDRLTISSVTYEVLVKQNRATLSFMNTYYCTEVDV